MSNQNTEIFLHNSDVSDNCYTYRTIEKKENRMKINKRKTERFENNQVSLRGKIVSPFTFSHEIKGEGFYRTEVEILRLSEQADIIPVVVSDRLIETGQDMTGMEIDIKGQFRSYNRYEKNQKIKLVLFVFAQEICFFDGNEAETEEMWDVSMDNQIVLDGYICKMPVYRKTPLGREITDVLLAVNRPYGKSDYIPLILWGRNARFAGGLEIGTRVQAKGRIQSRDYMKKLDNGKTEKRVAYEVSVSKIETMN